MKHGAWILLAVLALAGMGSSGEHPEHPSAKTAKASAPAMMIEAKVTGENICIGCALKASQGAAAQCGTYGHEHVLKVKEVTAGGKTLGGMTGWTLSYLKNDQSKAYLEGHTGETLALEGKIYPESRVLEVTGGAAPAKAEHPGGSEHPNGHEHPKGSEHPGGSK